MDGGRVMRKIGALLLSVSNTLPSCLTFYFAVFVKKEAFSKQDLLNPVIVSQRRGAGISLFSCVGSHKTG